MEFANLIEVLYFTIQTAQLFVMLIKLIHLLAEESKNNANDDKHECHANENTDHRRIDVPEAG